MSLNTIRVCFLYDYVKGNKISDATNLVANWRERICIEREREKERKEKANPCFK